MVGIVETLTSKGIERTVKNRLKISSRGSTDDIWLAGLTVAFLGRERSIFGCVWCVTAGGGRRVSSARPTVEQRWGRQNAQGRSSPRYLPSPNLGRQVARLPGYIHCRGTE